jgi:CRP-like cAMP-binding protein
MEPFDANFFTMLKLVGASVRAEIEEAFTPRQVGANEVIYEAGDAADSVYIVASGVVEAITMSADKKQTRSVAHMERGDFFGDLGVLTGQTRLATVRTCEPVSLLTIEKGAFLQLLEKIPKLSLYFTRNIARRLHATSTLAHLSVFDLDLNGNLQHFDLLTIFQAISGSGPSGELLIHNPAHDLIGNFFFRHGRVEQARFTHLVGLEAVWQCFIQSATAGTFAFRVREEPTVNTPPEHNITLESVDLLMQGAGKRDIYQALPEELRRMTSRLRSIGSPPVCPDEATALIVAHLWEWTAKKPQTLDSLWRRLPCSALTLLELVVSLGEAGQIELETPPPAEAAAPAAKAPKLSRDYVAEPEPKVTES